MIEGCIMSGDRVVICSLAKSFGTEGDRGKVNVFFETISYIQSIL